MDPAATVEKEAPGTETLIPDYIHRVTELRFFGLNDFDFDSPRDETRLIVSLLFFSRP